MSSGRPFVFFFLPHAYLLFTYAQSIMLRSPGHFKPGHEGLRVLQKKEKKTEKITNTWIPISYEFLGCSLPLRDNSNSTASDSDGFLSAAVISATVFLSAVKSQKKKKFPSTRTNSNRTFYGNIINYFCRYPTAIILLF